MFARHIKTVRSWALAACGLSSVAALAQVEPAGVTSPFALSAPVTPENFNFRLGSLELDFRATFGVEANDNVNISEDDPLEDLILKPGLSVGTRWQITEAQSIDFAVGAEYWYYVNDNQGANSNGSNLRITPQTEIAYRVRLGDAIFRVYNRFEYRFDADEDFISPTAGENEVVNQRFENEFGVQTAFNFYTDNEVFVQVARIDQWTPETEFEYINNTVHEARLRLERAVAANLRVGLGTSFAVQDYELDVNNDGRSFTIGPFAEYGLTEYLSLFGLVAWNNREFDTTGADTNDSFQGLSWNLRLTHLVNPAFSHSVGVFQEPRSSGIANFSEATGGEYRANWAVLQPIVLNGFLRFEQVEASGSALGIAPDDYERFTAGVGFGYQLGPRLFANVNYRYNDRDSDAVGRSYTQNQFLVDLSYDF